MRKTILAAALALPLALGCSSAATASACPSLVSHDGYTGEADGGGPIPVDSVAALNNAARLGSRQVKFDERWSVDNVPVTIHNATVYASTGYISGGVVHHHHGQVQYKTAATLESFHLLTRPGAYTSSRLPSTVTMLRAAVAAGDTSAIIEIKVPVITAAQVASLRAAVSSSGAASITSVQTFFTQNVTALRAGWPGLTIALLEHVPATPPAGVSSVVLTGSAVASAAVNNLASAGLLVGEYTSTGAGVPDDAASWSAGKAAGIRQVFTDNTPGFLSWTGAGCP